MNKILITGATGFLGHELMTTFTDHKNIRVLSRNEGKLIELKQQYPDIEIMTGDIGDEFIAQRAVKDADAIYHLSAFKHVGLAEEQPYQCIVSNLMGTMNLLKHFRGEMFLAISTDKAAQVAGVYGATKFLMERIISEYETINLDTKYRIVRYGNVLYSTGSVLCKWRELIKADKEVIITDMDATRFFWTRKQAIGHIYDCIETADDSTPYIPEMKAMNMYKLLLAMYRKYGNGNQPKIRTIGLQPGENLHETMDGVTFSDQVEQFNIDEIIEMI